MKDMSRPIPSDKRIRNKREKREPVMHGLSRHPLYKTWVGMMGRCYNPNDSVFHRYGARGIRVVKRWHDFQTFLSDMGERPSRAHSLDRIDNDSHYKPDNVRWATQAQQLRNTRRNHWITWNGQTHILSDWPAICGLSFGLLRYRLDRRCFFPTMDDVFLTPKGKRPPKAIGFPESWKATLLPNQSNSPHHGESDLC